MSEQHDPTLEEQQPQSPSKRKRIRYTSELKLKLIRLCIQNGDRYIKPVPQDDFWSYIRTQFLECNSGNGSTIRRKVADIVSERKAAIAIRRAQSGVVVAVAPPATDLEQAIDTWIEWMDRRAEEKQARNAQSPQIKQDKEKAVINHQNLSKSSSEKRTFQEVQATVDLADSDTVRDKRQKTGEAWASGKDMQENWDRLDRRKEEMLALLRDILNAISATSATPSANTPSTNPNIPATPTASTASTHSSEPSASASSTDRRLATLEAEISEMHATQLEILRILSEMRR